MSEYRDDETSADPSQDSEVDFDDEREDDQSPLDDVEASEVGATLDDPEELSESDDDLDDSEELSDSEDDL
jgi:hypothetical protein